MSATKLHSGGGRPEGANRGSILMEVVVALVIVSVAGTALLQRTAATLSAHRRAVDREREMWAAHQVLSGLYVLPRQDLELRIGRRRVGDLTVQVDRPEPGLFRIGVSRWDQPGVEILMTAAYRPPPGS